MNERIYKYLKGLKEKYNKNDYMAVIDNCTVQIVWGKYSNKIVVQEIEITRHGLIKRGDDLIEFIEKNKGKIEEGLK